MYKKYKISNEVSTLKYLIHHAQVLRNYVY